MSHKTLPSTIEHQLHFCGQASSKKIDNILNITKIYCYHNVFEQQTKGRRLGIFLFFYYTAFLSLNVANTFKDYSQKIKETNLYCSNDGLGLKSHQFKSNMFKLRINNLIIICVIMKYILIISSIPVQFPPSCLQPGLQLSLRQCLAPALSVQQTQQLSGQFSVSYIGSE